MALLAPLALLLGLLAAPILILYMLKLRRREVEVSSTLLWQLLLRDREANAPWQKLRRNLLLFVQLLLLLALVLALARPFFKVPTIAAGTLVVLLDGSASMQAADGVGGTRFEQARAAARRLIDELSSGGTLALILVGHQPVVLAPPTSNQEVLRAALAQAQPSEAPANWEAALALAAGTVRAGQASESVVVIISDGGLPPDLPPLPAEVRYLPVGSSADNLALQALALRATSSGPQLFANVANYGDTERRVLISLAIDGQLRTAQELTVPANGEQAWVLQDLPPDAAVYEARLSPPAGAGDDQPLDQLALDDTAWAVYQPPATGRVLVITPGNIFLEQVFAALSGSLGLQPFKLKQGQSLPPEPFDLYVFDSIITDTLPTRDLLLVNPSSNDLFQVGGYFTNTKLVRVAENDPLTKFVDWSRVNLRVATRIDVPSWARVLVEAEGGPLVFVGEVGGRRVAVLTFDLHDSDLPLQVTYPVLMANLIGYLSPAQAFSAPDGLRPGEALTIKPGGGGLITVIDPHGRQSAAAASEAGVLFADTLTLGVYEVRSTQGLLGRFSVNLFDPLESRIHPAGAITVGRVEVTAAPPQAEGQLEIWPWLAGAALALLLLEWWLYQRGATLPAGPGWRGWPARRKAG
ncbi:MAG: VWA domain-containing protein [Anaerolineales bacterium]|nr:VWA domain-containing protein [Anaerolineales bacterium]